MKFNFEVIPENIKSILRKTYLYKRQAIKSRYIVHCSEVDKILNQAPPILLQKTLLKKPYIAIVKTQNSELVKEYVNPKASWLRYERFCKKNDIPYQFYDITKSNWIEEAEKFDIIICHTESSPSYQDMIESKIYILENMLGKCCFPSYHEIWQYENKVRSNYLYQIHDLPSIPTLITHNKKEAINFINTASYPFITKTTIGSSSKGVTKVSSYKKAKFIVNSIFSNNGLKTYYTYQRQKDYFYTQTYIDDASFDLRIMIIGKKAFGYYRYPNKGDFRASGSGNIEKTSIPYQALRLAINIKNKLNSRLLGIDLLYSEKYNSYLIIETSLFNQIDTPEQLVIDQIPGYYDISDIDNIIFKNGKFWIQELTIYEVVNNWIETNIS